MGNGSIGRPCSATVPLKARENSNSLAPLLHPSHDHACSESICTSAEVSRRLWRVAAQYNGLGGKFTRQVGPCCSTSPACHVGRSVSLSAPYFIIRPSFVAVHCITCLQHQHHIHIGSRKSSELIARTRYSCGIGERLSDLAISKMEKSRRHSVRNISSLASICHSRLSLRRYVQPFCSCFPAGNASDAFRSTAMPLP